MPNNEPFAPQFDAPGRDLAEDRVAMPLASCAFVLLEFMRTTRPTLHTVMHAPSLDHIRAGLQAKGLPLISEHGVKLLLPPRDYDTALAFMSASVGVISETCLWRRRLATDPSRIRGSNFQRLHATVADLEQHGWQRPAPRGSCPAELATASHTDLDGKLPGRSVDRWVRGGSVARLLRRRARPR